MKIALLGGRGYIGGRLALHLKEAGHTVCVVTRRSPETIQKTIAALEYRQIAYDNPRSVSVALGGMDAVVHLAAPDEVDAAQDPGRALVDSAATARACLLVLAKEAFAGPIVYLSTFHVYGSNGKGDVTEETIPCPVHPYGQGRLAGELVVQGFRQTSKLNLLNARMSNVFGAPSDLNVSRWSLLVNDLCLQAVAAGKMILRSAGQQKRNFISMTDAVRGLEFLLKNSDRWPLDGILHLGSARTLSIREMAEIVQRVYQQEENAWAPLEVGSSADSAEALRSFSIHRLESLGFEWKNNFVEEIQKTLQLCVEGKKRWGSGLLEHCRAAD